MENIKELNTMERKELTIKDVLVDVMGILGKVKVSIEQLEEIGMPIRRAISGIRICVDSIEKAEANAGMETQEEDPQEDGEKEPIRLVNIEEISGENKDKAR